MGESLDVSCHTPYAKFAGVRVKLQHVGVPSPRHSSIQITLDTYSHVAPGLQEAAAVRFDEIINPTSEKEAVEKVG